MVRQNLISLVVLGLALGLGGCSCGAHHRAPEDGPIDDGGREPHAGEDGSDADDANEESAGRDGGRNDGGRDAAVSEDAAVPDRIPTSGSHAVLLSGFVDDVAPRQLIALDLESGDTHLLAENDALSFAHVSPDRSTILFGGDERATKDNFFIARVDDDGVVPGAAVTGADGDVGDRSVLGWSDSGQFALLARTSMVNEHAIDLIDTRAGRQHWTAESDVTSIKDGTFAPRGYWFSYAISGHNGSSGVARITSTGIEPIEDLMLNNAITTYSPSGSRIAYVRDGGTGPLTYYRDLKAGAEPVEILISADPALAGVYPLAFSGDDDHLLVHTLTASGDPSLRRVDLESGMATEITLPERAYIASQGANASGLLGVKMDNAAAQDELWLVDPLGEREPALIETLMRDGAGPALEGVQLGAAGSSHYFYVQHFRDLTFVARASDGSIASSVVSGPEDEGFGCLPLIFDGAYDSDRVAFIVSFGDALVIVDLSQPLAERVARVEPRHGGHLSCPAWNAERTALAFVEQVEADSRSFLYTVQWPEAGVPAQPELIYESEHFQTLVLYSP
jgi:hypothetical protein